MGIPCWEVVITVSQKKRAGKVMSLGGPVPLGERPTHSSAAAAEGGKWPPYTSGTTRVPDPLWGLHTAQGQINLPLFLCCLQSLSEQQSVYKRDTSYCGGGRGLQARGCRKLAEGPEHSPALSHQALSSASQFSRSAVPDSLRPLGLQYARPSCPSPTPGVYSNTCSLSR